MTKAAQRGLDDAPSAWQQQRSRRDGPQHHITFLSKSDLQCLTQSCLADVPATIWEDAGANVPDAADVNSVSRSICAMLSKMPSCWDWIDIGTGSCKDDAGESVFRAVLWPAAAAVRAKLGLQAKDFHITLGFHGCDVHSKPKGLSSLRRAPVNSSTLSREASLLLSSVPPPLFSVYEGSIEQLASTALLGADDNVALEAEALQVQCQFYGRVKRADEVLASSERLLQLRHDDVIGCRSRAFALVMLSRHEEAMPALEMAQSQLHLLPLEQLEAEQARVTKALLHCKKRLGISISSLPAAGLVQTSDDSPKPDQSASKSNYPKTPHLPFSPGINPDDTRVSDCQKLLSVEVVITEKLDGGNCCIKADSSSGMPLVFGRTHAQPATHESFSAVKELATCIGDELGDLELFGENMQAVHSIEYDNLASYFYAT